MKMRLFLTLVVALAAAAPARSEATAAMTALVAQNGDGGPPPAKGKGISGNLRDGFVNGGMKSCVDKAREGLKGNEEFLNKMGVTSASLQTYCQCALNYAADNIEPSDMIDLVKGSVTPSLMEKMKAGMEVCLKSILPKK